MKTQDEIVARISAIDDPTGWQRQVMVGCLDFEHARPFLVDGTTAAEWAEQAPATNEAEIREQMRAYVEFAWGKIADHRGISASRSIEKLIAWLWLLDEETVLVEMEIQPYAQYGAPRLRVVCEAYGWPIPESRAVRRMAEGLKCTDDCDLGCGRL